MNPDTLRQILEPVLQQLEPDTLFIAYNYLSSAIAQAFAALIALTAMFYIYKKQALRNQLNDTLNNIRGFAWVAFCGKEHDEQERLGVADKDYSVEYLGFYQLCPPQKILEFAEQDLDILSGQMKEDCQKATKKYRWLENLYRNFAKIIIPPIIISAFAMAAGIAALLYGWWFFDVSIVLAYVIMILESLLAALALGWTVFVVIRMLAEPAEPQAKGNDGQGA